MNVIDVHPDDLFDRELAGTLTEEERARLDAHVAKCEACQLERQLRADFRAEEELHLDGPSDHPDDLFDLELAGTISPAERKALDAHVSQCGVCAVERQLRADFGAELGASEEKAASLLGEVRLPLLTAVERAREAPTSRRSVSMYSAGASRRKLQWALAAAMVVGTSMAAVGSPKVVAAFQAAVEEVRSVVAPKRVAANRSVSKGASALPSVADRQEAPKVQEAQSQEPSQDPAAATPVVEPIVAPKAHPETLEPAPAVHEAPRAAAEAPHAFSSPKHARSVSDATNGITPPKASTVALVPAQTTPVAAAPVQSAPAQTALVEPVRASEEVKETSATLFSSAARARKQGDVAKALAMYEALQTKYPSTPEARVSHVMVGRLAHESHDDVRALKAFDAYLVSGDKALREDALVGAARASERARLQGKERDMWTRLLGEYPNSSYAEQATRRILELGAAAK